jgi:hypothetical protein
LKPLSGHLVLAVFFVLQFADGLITFEAVRSFGTVAEGNPLLATWMAIAGPGPALLGAKIVACACATVLYRCGHVRTLACLSTAYIVLAVGPWLHVLTTLAK